MVSRLVYVTAYLDEIVTDGDHPTGYYVAFGLWIVSAFISTCYTFTWDIKMDWGLFDGKYFLREHLIYSKKVKFLPDAVCPALES